jgi:hypothetical protein
MASKYHILVPFRKGFKGRSPTEAIQVMKAAIAQAHGGTADSHVIVMS